MADVALIIAQFLRVEAPEAVAGGFEDDYGASPAPPCCTRTSCLDLFLRTRGRNSRERALAVGLSGRNCETIKNRTVKQEVLEDKAFGRNLAAAASSAGLS